MLEYRYLFIQFWVTVKPSHNEASMKEAKWQTDWMRQGFLYMVFRVTVDLWGRIKESTCLCWLWWNRFEKWQISSQFLHLIYSFYILLTYKIIQLGLRVSLLMWLSFMHLSYILIIFTVTWPYYPYIISNQISRYIKFASLSVYVIWKNWWRIKSLFTYLWLTCLVHIVLENVLFNS